MDLSDEEEDSLERIESDKDPKSEFHKDAIMAAGGESEVAPTLEDKEVWRLQGTPHSKGFGQESCNFLSLKLKV